jgi:tetratricopeptide (TPR) repeat protein
VEEKFLVPYEQNPRFTGRQQFLERLKETLIHRAPNRDNHRIALYGMGGIGKTQTALQYVYNNRSLYDRIYWISAVNQASLFAGFQKIAKTARLATPTRACTSRIVELVLAWLRRERNWLIVIDNLDDFEVVKGFLPENSVERHTLITTRNRDSSGIPAEGVEVPLLDQEDAITLLSSLTKITVTPESTEEQQAEAIVEDLGYLPLAIEQAAAYIRQVAGDFGTYQRQYRQSCDTIHRWVPSGNRSYPYSVATTWSMSFDAVQHTHTHAAELFRLLSFLNPDGVLVDFLLAGVKVLKNPLRKVVAIYNEMAAALLQLEKFSLVKWNRPTKTISMHRLMQSVFKDKLSKKELDDYFQTIIDLCDQSFPAEVTYATRPICRTYLSQIVGPLLQINTKSTAKYAKVLERIGKFLADDGKFHDSERVLLHALEISSKIKSVSRIYTLRLDTVYSRLAELYEMLGQQQKSVQMQEELLKKAKWIIGQTWHPHSLEATQQLAWTYIQSGRIMEGMELQERVLRRRKWILGPNHRRTLDSMSQLAWMMYEIGGRKDAIQLHETMVKKTKRKFGEDDPKTIDAMDSLSTMYGWEPGRTAEGMTLQEVVYEKSLRVFGDAHQFTLLSMRTVGCNYKLQGRPNALEMLESALEKTKLVLGEDHLDTLEVVDMIASMHAWEPRRMAEALELQEQVLEKRKRICGDDHVYTLLSMRVVGLNYALQGRPNGIKMLEETLEKMKHLFGDEYPSTLVANYAFASSFGQERRAEEIQLKEKLLEKIEESLRYNSDGLAAVIDLTWSYGLQGYTEAKGLLEKMLAMTTKLFGKEHPTSLIVAHNVALMQRRSGQVIAAPPVENLNFMRVGQGVMKCISREVRVTEESNRLGR